MKRIAWIVAGVLLSALALFALLVALVPRDALKARLSEQIAGWTGRDVSARGEPEISVFPALSVTLNDVHVGGPEGMDNAEILSMDRLTGTIRLLPLVIGRIEVGSYTMERPLVHLVRDKEGRRNWDFDSGAAALQLAFEGDVPLGDFGIAGGTIVYDDQQAGNHERLDSVNVSIDWPSVRQSMAVNGSGIWRGEEVTIAAGAKAPFSFLNGGATPLEARVESAPLTAIFTGQADHYPMAEMNGALKLSTPSLRRFASWLGGSVGPGSTLGQASGFGTVAFDRNGLSLTQAEFTLDGNDASGALKIEVTPKLDISGTLAFTNTLDLSPYFVGLSSVMALTDDWRRVSLPTDWFGDMNADIRLSAKSAKLGVLTATNAAASVSLREGRLEVGLAQAVFSEGTLTGNLVVTDAPDSAAMEMQLRATDIAFALAPPTLGLPHAISGIASILLDVTTKGRDLGALISQLTGTGRISVKSGSVPLFGMADVAAAAGGPANPEPAEGLVSVPVDSASAGFSFSGGVGMLQRGNVVTQAYSADIQGWIGLLDGTLGLNGAIKSAAAGTLASPAPEAVGFTIEGTLAEPVAHTLDAPPQPVVPMPQPETPAN